MVIKDKKGKCKPKSYFLIVQNNYNRLQLILFACKTTVINSITVWQVLAYINADSGACYNFEIFNQWFCNKKTAFSEVLIIMNGTLYSHCLHKFSGASAQFFQCDLFGFLLLLFAVETSPHLHQFHSLHWL